MKKIALIAATILATVLSANAQNEPDGHTILINGNRNFQIGAIASFTHMNGDNVFGGGADIIYIRKCWRFSGEFTYAKNGDVDRSSAGINVGYSPVGNPNVKFRPYLMAFIGGASQSAYSCYGTQISGGNSNVDVNMEFVHVYKTYDWNFQLGLKLLIDLPLSQTVTLSAMVGGVYNPNEGAQKWADLGNVNIDSPAGQHFEVSLQNLNNVVKSDKFGLTAAFRLSFRF